MNIQIYKKANTGKRKKLKKQITGLIIIGIVLISALWIIGIFAGDSDEYNERVSILEENHMLRQKLTELETENAGLKTRIAELEAYVSGGLEISDQTGEIQSENGLYYNNEETQPENPDSPRDIEQY